MSLRRRDLPRSVKTARMIPANAGLHRAYADKLTGLVRELSDSVTYWLLAEYRRQLPRVERMEATPVTALTARPAAEDASPARDLLARLRQQSRRWRKKFDEKAQAYAEWFAARALQTTTAAARNSLSEAAGFMVPMTMTRNVNNVVQAVVAENVNLIRSIGSQYFTEVEGLVLRSVRAGRDIAWLTDELEKRYGITRRRALTIARDQNNKASAAIGRARMQDAGIRLGVWRHTSVSRHPRKSHKAADGLVFDLSEGMLLDGKMIFPGEEINCGCRFEPVIERPGGRTFRRKTIDYDTAGQEYVDEWKTRMGKAQ